MTFSLRAAAVLALVWATPLVAEDRPVVVELFTSQGCSSCPAADAILAELAGREDVIPIALHVDYWDYIGWEDPFGNPAHAERQRAYASRAGRRSIYTPEMIVNGQTDIVGAKPMALSKAIAEHAKDPSPVALSVSRGGGLVKISAPAVGQPREMVVHLVRILPPQTSKITRGENRGKTITYTSVAQDWTVLGGWDGTGPLSIEAEAAHHDPAVVLVQEAPAGPILAAARVGGH